ncbi:hypothetical protein ACQR1I_36410, partial [Bradyrhizobium sp. HKCCYLS2038]|uniref:hypothetical protein n=1 Tax=Bradyrhizobium sp. HKCCYLS2038 TaxID=3420764 RepID=UPI003EBD377D
RSGRRGRRFESCRSDQHLARFPTRTAKSSAKETCRDIRSVAFYENPTVLQLLVAPGIFTSALQPGVAFGKSVIRTKIFLANVLDIRNIVGA